MYPVPLEAILTHQPERWLPPQFHSYNELLSAAVQHVVESRDAPRRLANWRWGYANPLVLQHPIFGKIPLLSHWSGPGTVPQSGNSLTVKQVTRDLGPSERMTVDLANLDASTFNVVTGESGHLLSPHFMDQWNAWYHGTTFPMLFSDEAVSKGKRHELKLVPDGKP
jgi:penicillin amidase